MTAWQALFRPGSRAEVDARRDKEELITIALAAVYGSAYWTLDRREHYWTGEELSTRDAAWKRLRRLGWRTKDARVVTTGAQSRKTLDAETREAMKAVTYQVEHNPNCRAPYLVRLPGYPESVIRGDERDAKGCGETAEEAYREAVAALEAQKAAARERRAA